MMGTRLPLAVLAAAAWAAPASANVGAPTYGGTTAGEVVGISDIAIVREELVIDLRRLAFDTGLVTVSATYHLDNAAAKRSLELVFAAGSATTELRVTLDGQPVSTHASTAKLPASWKPPATTPRIGGGDTPYELRESVAIPIGFALVVPPGRHDLVVVYNADPLHTHAGDPTRLYQFGYVLAPARTWASFGGLELTVHVPPGWRAALAPAVPRDGDTFHGVFPTVPADALGITVQASFGAYALIANLALALLGLVTVGGLVVLVVRTRAHEHRSRALGKVTSGWGALGRGLVLGIAFAGTAVFAVSGPDLALEANQIDHYGYGHSIGLIGAVLGGIVVFLVGGLLSHLVARHLNRTRV